MRELIVIAAREVDDYPVAPTWAGARFALFVAVDREVDPTVIAQRALPQGLASMCAWGPGCAKIHDIFDEEIVNDGSVVYETGADDVIVTTQHGEETLEEALEFFLGIAACDTRVIFALGDLAARIEGLL